MINKSEFSIRICSDLDYEEMVADICYLGTTVAIVTQEKGVNKMEIEIYRPHDEQIPLKFPLDDFIEAIQLAKKKLLEMQVQKE